MDYFKGIRKLFDNSVQFSEKNTKLYPSTCWTTRDTRDGTMSQTSDWKASRSTIKPRKKRVYSGSTFMADLLLTGLPDWANKCLFIL